ncbi:DUF3592 domain-containing protein [Kosakonia sp. BK9b]
MTGNPVFCVVLRSLKWVALFIVALGLVLFFFLWLMLSGVGETTVYSERNLWDYHTLTQDAIAQAPRISPTYHFEFHNGDGYPSSNSIIFEHASNAGALRDYLRSMGYQQDTRPAWDGERWSKPDEPQSDMFAISEDVQNKQITLTQTLSW